VCVRSVMVGPIRAGFSGYGRLRCASGPLEAAYGPRVTASATPHQISDFFLHVSFRFSFLGKIGTQVSRNRLFGLPSVWTVLMPVAEEAA